jgi:S-adenosylmethionine hydrolase
MKGVILGINPGARIVDISHTIEPQNILQAAFVLGTAHEAFPGVTVHLVVVDPGVGTERRGIILKTPNAYFVAPDNGVLTYVMQDYGQDGRLTPRLEGVSLTNRKYWRSPVSPTFHGRDVFAPVAAHLSLGVPLRDFGEAIASIRMLPVAGVSQRADGTLIGSVVHIDRFGNVITNIKCERMTGKPWKTVVEVAQHRIEGVSRTYSEHEGLLAITGSSNRLEIAMKEGSASQFLGARVGDEVMVRQE